MSRAPHPALPDLRVRRVTDPHDPALAAFGRIQEESYYAPDMLIPPEVFPHLLRATSGDREDRILVAETPGHSGSDGEVLGGTVYSLLRGPGHRGGGGSGAAFNSFTGVSPAAQGRGVGRALALQAMEDVRAAGLAGLFADSVYGERQSAEERAAEARTGTDPVTRRRALHALGLRTVDVPYWQPVGGPDGGPLQDLDLLYHPADTRTSAEQDTVPLALVTATLRAYWRGWLGEERAAREAEALAERAGHVPTLRLLPATETASYWRPS
ncbi:GNAT family N-acetyltransferase [Deinococcus petrolearius]|uniref:GNAT family N-acetyltransferase n=1 Tax=Deinococcus petrolearius TaxID=1751295 RepID=A0ABW1DPT1_9DEIO